MSIEQWVQRALSVSDYWPLNGSGPGVQIGQVTWPPGVERQAVSSAGGGGFMVTPFTSRTTSSFSLLLWVNIRDGQGDVFRWGLSPGVHVEAARNGSAASIGVGVRMSNGGWALRHTVQGLTLNRWHLVAVTVSPHSIWGGVNAAAYIDGSRVASGRYAGGLFDTVNFNKSGQASLLTSSLSASLDEVILISRAVSSSEVSSLWSVGERGTRAGYGWGITFG